MGLTSFLLKLARKILEQVLESWTQQCVNVIQQQVLEEIMGIIGNRENIWRGEDAEQFQEVLQKQIVSSVQDIIGVSTRTCDGLRQAAEVITQADTQAAQLVSDLKGTFARIYNN